MTDKEVNKLIEQILDSDVVVDNVNDDKKVEMEIKTLPMIALRGKVLFPKTLLNFDVGRPMSIAAVEAAVKVGSEIFISAQKNVEVEVPRSEDVFETGVVARIKQVIKIHNTGNIKVGVEVLLILSQEESISLSDFFFFLRKQIHAHLSCKCGEAVLQCAIHCR